MAAPYKVIVTKVTCYNSFVVDKRIENVVHYCPAGCQVYKHGVQCMVAHHSVCAELLKAPETSGISSEDITHRTAAGESVVVEDDSHFNPRVKKATAVQNTGSLKDITGEAINLASGKIKEFSFEKLRNASSQHVNLRKGRKVRPDSFGRKSADYDFIYGHFGNNENCPPFGLLPAQGSEEKAIIPHNVSLEQNINSMATLYLQGLSEENIISQILKKHKLDSSGSGEDIKMCLDILLKCSEDLKKCTNIIKQCIKNRSVGGNNGVGDGKGADHFPNPEIIYMNVMARLSSYLKKLPFEVEQGPHGRAEPNDLAELVSSLHSLQQQPFSPIYGHEQPPKYEDVVQTPPLLQAISRSPTDHHEEIKQNVNDGDTATKSPSSIAPPLPAKTWQRSNKQTQVGSTRKQSVSAHQITPQANITPGKTGEKSSRNSIDNLFIEEDSDLEKALNRKYKSGCTGLPETSKFTGESPSHPKTISSPAPGETSMKTFSNSSPSIAYNKDGSGTSGAITTSSRHSVEPSKVAKSDHEEIDKLLLDLERFSQKIENTLKNPPLSSSATCKLQSELPDVKADPGNLLSSTAYAKEEDSNLLLRILGSIEDFAQELVDWRSGRGTLSKQKEVMQILQETLVPSSPVSSPSIQNQSQVKDSGPTLSIQQTPEVIKVQSKQEKKPGTPPPVPVITPINSRPASPPPLTNKVTVTPPVSINIPRFYFPKGLPNPGPAHEDSIGKAEAAFSTMEDEKADIYEMGKITKVCGCPLFWKAAMFNGAGGERTGFVSVHSFIAMWRKLLQNCHDDASKFVYLLAKPGCSYLEQEDFIPLLQDIVDTHPGLTFLKEAPEFHSRYITTVIQRIFYTVNRSWSGRITLTELRRSNFLQTLALLEEEDDINQVTDYFSYEHFYVIYCKFWELDTDHDLYIDQKDLARYNDHASSHRIIERVFSGAVTRGNAIQREGRMSYAEFVWFLLSEEDKKNPTSIEYWFRCMDLDGDGVLSMYELEYFYEEQCEKMETMGIEPLPFQDLLCQLLDLVKPEVEGRITLRDLKRCRMAHIFYDTCFNLEKYLDHEQRDPFALQKDVDNENPEPSDWDRYAAEEYEILVAEESATEQLQEGSFEDDYEGDEIISAPEISNKMDKLVISDLTA
ncbi:serine/threonine-protein phosphatase 2A regulatory subunit B'' subunit alpha isoform X1 [Spea bombifrons]|uniref:serine/threonine-protein phosphatase 2A regulatory subunit B'' subunit alpha isoform X1 n=1 Tax=Spea bombifrons TaxID=233779 RepID=UPI0023495D5E|nr:serine/threonine-protein phosphatase 2A regulatory subunit B'' subunit alpha isoform X1 [Spea bombifrons]